MDFDARVSGQDMRSRTSILRLGGALLGVLLFSGVCRAGLDNSHHDVRSFHAGADPCLACHGKDSSSYLEMLPNRLGTNGGMCLFLCHSGKGMLPETVHLVPDPGPLVDIRDYSVSHAPDFTAVYFDRSHGNDPANLVDGEGKPVPWPPAGAPWADRGGAGKMECTSCHSVHENTYPPFLRSPFAAGYPDRNGFCDRCHHQWATNNLSGPPDGMHPVDFPVDNAAAELRLGSGRHPRRIRIQRYGRADGGGAVPVFDVPNPSPSAFNDRDTHWRAGGHLAEGGDRGMSGWRGSGSKQMLGCYTCHPAHRPRVAGEAALMAVPLVDADTGWNPLCVGCHGNALSLAGDRMEWDVGTTGFGHPAGTGTRKQDSGEYRTTVGGFLFRIADVTFRSPGRGNRFGRNGQLMCTTCHKVHFGTPGSMALADLGQGTRSICKSCHSGGGIPNENDWSKGGTVTTGQNQLNTHHVTTYRVSLDWKHIPEKEEDTILAIRSPSWADPISGLGMLASGMDCADCHVFNKTAHNW